ncbi:hypothetical protein P7C70_g3662, partial [Phenoliferia sp. Uapishka_3]
MQAQQNGDFWLRASIQIGPFPTGPPNDQQVAELLAKQPWNGWNSQAGELPFQYDTVDRPEPGSALLAFLQPSRPPPPDGLRYLPASPSETISSTTHTVSCPTTIQQPTTISTIQVQLSCYTITNGHLPPTSRTSGLLPDSPELRLSRYRKRWHISKGGGHPNLWLYYWGRDHSGGKGPGAEEAPLAPQGWEREPIRAYPLSKNPQTEPVWVFGSRIRMAGPGSMPGSAPPPMLNGAGGGPGLMQTGAQQMSAQQLAMQQHAMASAAAAAAGGGGGGSGGGPLASFANSPYARQAPHLAGMPPGSQQQYIQQQQLALQQQAYLAAQGGGVGGGGGPPGAGGGGQPSAASYQQMQAHQQAMLNAQANSQAKSQVLTISTFRYTFPH